jgi:hypothetical protein
MLCARGVGRLLPVMLSAIEFDDELRFAAGEINDVRTDKRLPPEVRTDQYNVITKPLPEHALGIGRFCAHPVRKLSVTINHRVRFNHIRHRLWTPTPDPSPQEGEGSRGLVDMKLEFRRRRLNQTALPASVCTQASPQAFASSRTRMM